MRSLLAKSWLLSIALVLALLAPDPASADGFFRHRPIVVFGDSLSDPGNAFAANRGRQTTNTRALNMVTLPRRLAASFELVRSLWRFARQSTIP